MEKYVFVKEGDHLLPVKISERLYEEITGLTVVPEKKVRDWLVEAKQEELGQTDADVGLAMNVQSSFIFVKDRDYFRRIEFSCIRWIQASGSYSCLNLDSAPKVMLAFNLRELSEHLPANIFVRVHRSYIVNINYIDSFIGNTLGIGKEQIPVSRQHKRCVVARLNILGNVKL